MGHNKTSYMREVYSNEILSQETREILNKQPKITPKRKKNKQNLKLVEGNKSQKSEHK